MAKLVLLEPAQRELEEIAQLHRNLVGPNSARKITNKMFDALSRLELSRCPAHFPAIKRCSGMGTAMLSRESTSAYTAFWVILSTFITLRMVPAIIRACSSVFCGMKKSKCIHVFTLPLLYCVESIPIIQFLLRKEVIA